MAGRIAIYTKLCKGNGRNKKKNNRNLEGLKKALVSSIYRQLHSYIKFGIRSARSSNELNNMVNHPANQPASSQSYVAVTMR